MSALHVDYAGLFTHSFPKEWEGQPACVLSGGPRAHHGVRMGVPCILVADPSSPLRFGMIGDLCRDDAREMRARAKEGNVTVVLLGNMDVIRGVRGLFGCNVRIEYTDVTS